MSIFGSWVVTLAFFFVLFLVGKYLQTRERSNKLTRKAEAALRAEMRPQSWEPGSMYGTIFGSPTQYERRRTGSR